MGIKKTLASIVLASAAVLGLGGKANADWNDFKIIGPSTPISGYPAGAVEEINYVSPDGKYMLVTDGNGLLSSRSFNSQYGRWSDRNSSGLLQGYGHGCLSYDGNTLFGNGISLARQSEGKWVEQSSITLGSYPSFNGKQLYFNTDDFEDIKVIDYNPSKNIFENERHLNLINTSYREQSPWISSDGKFLIFESNRPGGYGGFDLYFATRDSISADNWTNVTNMGDYINNSWDNSLGKIAEKTEPYMTLFSTYGGGSFIEHAQAYVTPEPSTLGFFALGGLGALINRRKK